jgi:membrane protein implicated in regulation of membrane protease activity
MDFHGLHIGFFQIKLYLWGKYLDAAINLFLFVMIEWFNSLEPMLKIYWGIALVASLIFVMQVIISLAGGDFDNMDFDADGDSHGVSGFFSGRNLVNFLLGAGWAGVALYGTISSKALLTFVAVVVGVVFVLMFFAMIKALLKLQKDNTFRIEETLNKVASVYLTIPENKSRNGKIQISVRGSTHEIDALTEGERIPTGENVRVVEALGNYLVLVEKL